MNQNELIKEIKRALNTDKNGEDLEAVASNAYACKLQLTDLLQALADAMQTINTALLPKEEESSLTTDDELVTIRE